MPAYTAQRPSLFGNVGQGGPERPMVDVGGAIQQLGGVASSLIHQHYLRVAAQRAQEQAYARQNAEDEYRRADRADRERDRAEQHDYNNKRLEIERIKSGVTLGTEGGATVDEEAPTPTLDAPTPSLHSAMTKGMSGPQGAPAPTSPLTKPVTRGSLGTIPNVRVGEEAPTPASYDPAHDMTLQRNRTLQADKSATMLRLRDMMGTTQKEVARIRAGGTVRAAEVRAGATGKGGSGGGLHGRLTANAFEKRFETVDAPALLENAGWDLDAATAALNNTPEGEALRKEGFTARHLSAAWGKHAEALAGHAMRLETGSSDYGAGEAVAAVDSTRKLVRGKRGAPAAAAAPSAPNAAQGEYDKAAAMYQAILKAGRVTPAEAKAAYDARIASIAKRHGQVK